jgi:hypothetical protein
VAWRQVLASIKSRALARLDQDGLVIHRLTQAIVRGHLPQSQATAALALGAVVLAANHPGDEALPSTWPGWARLLPHLRALNPDASTAALRNVTYDAAWYLIRRAMRATATAWPAAYTSSV